MEIRNARNVTLYGLKGEGNFRILRVRDSDNVRVFGYGGNAAAFERTSLFRFERTPNFLVANAVDQPRLPGKGFGDYWAGRGVDPREWHIAEAPEWPQRSRCGWLLRSLAAKQTRRQRPSAARRRKLKLAATRKCTSARTGCAGARPPR